MRVSRREGRTDNEIEMKTCAFAALEGHLEVLSWARENGCDWSAEACAMAAENGQLEVLEWLRGNEPPCPW